MESKRITIFTGHFGSGKTEMAINYAMACAKANQKTMIIDLDIVNPFFRTAEKRKVLEQEGIKVLAPNFSGTSMDVPSLPSEIISAFHRKEYKVIFDVGGDDVGATALGRYYPYFIKDEYDMFYVINTKRPLSNTQEDIVEMLQSVEIHSRLRVRGLINNTNLSYETTVYDIMEGQDLIEQVSKVLGVPILYIAGMPQVLEKLPVDCRYEAFPLDLYMRPFIYGTE